MSFTDGSDQSRPVYDNYLEYDSVLGKIWIDLEKINVSDNILVKYVRHPWMERIEVSGVIPVPAKRTGYGTKDVKGFVKSLSSIYPKAYDDYWRYGGDPETHGADRFDAAGYFKNAAEYFASRSCDEEYSQLYRKFCGFVENMWREGTEEIFDLAIDVVLPVIETDAGAWDKFLASITDEFREATVSGS